jgi:magnesium-transporting ATPase (P-type)
LGLSSSGAVFNKLAVWRARQTASLLNTALLVWSDWSEINCSKIFNFAESIE